MLVAIEGIDGAGKGTCTRLVAELFQQQGYKVAIISFPAYHQTAAARQIVDVLNAKTTHINPSYLAMLFAMDRYEYFAINQLPNVDIVLCDRYTASNAAFQSARLPKDLRPAFCSWIENLEHEQLHLPRQRVNILLRIRPDQARELIHKKKERTYTNRTLDQFESDITYQHVVADAYDDFTKCDGADCWRVVDVCSGSGLLTPQQVAFNVKRHIDVALSSPSG